MAKSSRAHSASSSAKTCEPIGGRYYPRYRTAVSGQFIESLRNEGVSGGTIDAIRRDSAKREGGGAINPDQSVPKTKTQDS
jgi:hypothetical protein